MKDNDKKPTPMGEHFDLSEAYAREAQPLVEKLHEWCVENKVPVVASVVYSNDDRKIAQHMMNAFFGVERTPPEFIVAKRVLEEKAIGAVIYKMLPMIESIASKLDDGDELEVVAAAEGNDTIH